MHLGKSLKIAMAMADEDTNDLAEALGVSYQAARRLIRNKHWNGSTLVKVADHFELKVSEFVMLGE